MSTQSVLLALALWLAQGIPGILPTASASPDTPLLAGLSASDVTPRPGVPLGGYGAKDRRLIPFDFKAKHRFATFFKPATGTHDPIRAKALVLKRGARQLLFLSLDLVGVTEDFRDEILPRIQPLGFEPDGVFFSATHTHSGPGTLSRTWLWEWLVMDLHQPKIRARFVDGIVATIEAALRAAEPAELFAYSFEAEGLQRNRRVAGGPVDRTANVLLVAPRGRPGWLGGLVNLAVHGTALHEDNLLFSADVPGGIERALEARLWEVGGAPGATAPTVLFINGAEGDVSPSHHGFAGIDQIGAEFAEQAFAALPSARLVDPHWRVRTETLSLGEATFHLRGCAPDKYRDRIARKLRIGLGPKLPSAARLSVLRLGDMTLLTWPGEPTTALGLALKEAASAPGTRQTWVLGLTDGHMGYFTTPEEFAAGGYEACSTMHGPQAGAKVLAAYRSLLAGGR